MARPLGPALHNEMVARQPDGESECRMGESCPAEGGEGGSLALASETEGAACEAGGLGREGIPLVVKSACLPQAAPSVIRLRRTPPPPPSAAEDQTKGPPLSERPSEILPAQPT